MNGSIINSYWMEKGGKIGQFYFFEYFTLNSDTESVMKSSDSFQLLPE